MFVLWIGMLIRTFFWWNPNKWKKTIPQDTGTWFIDEIINTWNNTENPQTNTWNNTENNDMEINVMMPRYFYTAGRKRLAQDLYTQNKIYLKRENI